MISVPEAVQILTEHPIQIKSIRVPLKEAIGQMSMQEIRADRDFPPYNRVTMDGIAISQSAFVAGQRTFPISRVIAAGEPQSHVHDQKNCVEIMTGAVLPTGLDTVIRYEDLAIENGQATILLDEIPLGLNVHHQGSDRRTGEVISPAKRRLSPAEIAIAATTGHDQLSVAEVPKVLIVSTGDELVPVHEIPEPHQIRTSNNFTIAAALNQMGLEVEHAHLADDEGVVKRKIAKFLEDYAILILIGGSSKGKFDYIPTTLRSLGIEEHFYKVAQRPGKPFMFGTRKDRNYVFALPGNPVSSFMCLMFYFKHWMAASYGLEITWPQAQLQHDVIFKPNLTYFAQVHLSIQGAQMMATPVEGHGSGDLANLCDADAFLILPEGLDRFPSGGIYSYVPYRLPSTF